MLNEVKMNMKLIFYSTQCLKYYQKTLSKINNTKKQNKDIKILSNI